MRRRLSDDVRKSTIVDAALTLAERDGFTGFTRDAVATAAGCSMGLVNHHFGTMNQLRRDVMRAAIRQGVIAVVAQGLAARDPQALKAPQELKDRAARSLTGE